MPHLVIALGPFDGKRVCARDAGSDREREIHFITSSGTFIICKVEHTGQVNTYGGLCAYPGLTSIIELWSSMSRDYRGEVEEDCCIIIDIIFSCLVFTWSIISGMIGESTTARSNYKHLPISLRSDEVCWWWWWGWWTINMIGRLLSRCRFLLVSMLNSSGTRRANCFPSLLFLLLVFLPFFLSFCFSFFLSVHSIIVTDHVFSNTATTFVGRYFWAMSFEVLSLSFFLDMTGFLFRHDKVIRWATYMKIYINKMLSLFFF